MSVALALSIAFAMAGCGGTTYFAGRTLPPSGLTNRVLIAIQNPNSVTKGALQFVDAYYDIRSGYTDSPPSFSIAGYTNALPSTTFAVLRATPGSVSSCSIVSGTFPPNSLTTFFAAPEIDFALL